ncbi:MAG: response regulator [Magnetococcales bacterium]|nr:response regulator [Magnetococcales bacterium]
MNKSIILIVDDAPENLDVLIHILRGEYMVRPALNGQTALRLALLSPQPDLILLDVNMPEMDGYEVCRRIKSDPRTSNIPILFVTGKGEIEDKILGLESGADDYIVKPIHPHIVLLRVKHHLALRRHREHLELLVRERTAQLEEARQVAEVGREAAEAGNRAKSAFLAVVGHELRTPLNTIIGFSSLLAEEEGNANDCQKYGAMIRNSSAGLLTMINEILDYIKLESGELALIVKPFSLSSWSDALVAEMTGPANRKGLTLTVARSPDLPETLCGDAGRLRQVVRHLLDNAIKFTKTGRVELRIGQDVVTPEGIMVRFSVQDTGPGIPAHRVADIFSRFTQLEPALTRAHGGLGMGLSLCRLLARRMGGEISLDSRTDVGSTFHFTTLLRQ